MDEIRRSYGIIAQLLAASMSLLSCEPILLLVLMNPCGGECNKPLASANCRRLEPEDS
jgi:hypothetical protein